MVRIVEDLLPGLRPCRGEIPGRSLTTTLARRTRADLRWSAEPRHRARNRGSRIIDPVALNSVPAQIGLYDVLGLRQRAEHPIREAGEPPPMRLERLRSLILLVHHAAL